MTSGMSGSKIAAAGVLAIICGAAWAQTSVTYGRITAVNLVTESNRGAQTGGALVGGTLGLISGSG